jgi:hypothetical protein
MTETFVSSIFVGFNRAYIYIWVSKTHKVIYVGMTNSRNGTLGRASQHLDARGTLRTNFLNNVGYNIDHTNDLKLLSFRLPATKNFTSVERSYREAVEYLVQKELLLLRGAVAPTFDVISWVRASSRLGNGVVRKAANEIVKEFKVIYPTL